jgi:hypothetical protein
MRGRDKIAEFNEEPRRTTNCTKTLVAGWADAAHLNKIFGSQTSRSVDYEAGLVLV